MEGCSIKGICPVHLLDGCGLVLGSWWGRENCWIWCLETENVSKFSPRMGWWQSATSEVSSAPACFSMVVYASNSHRYDPGSNPRRRLFNSIFSQRNWCVKTMGSKITSLRDGYVSLFLHGTRETEGAGKVELVSVGGLWGTGGECLLVPVWKSVRAGSVGKGKLDGWAFKAVT